jgi:diguanylate cyclase (GGDEF)-like protein
MTREVIFNKTKIITISLGAVLLVLALATMPRTAFTWGFLLALVIAVVFAPRMSLPLPRSKFAISFSDALIFLTFLIYGGRAAIILSAAEMLANCFYLRSTGFKFGRLMIPVNVATSVLTTSLTFIVWQATTGLFGDDFSAYSTPDLITILGVLALAQFFFSSTIVSVFQSIKEGTSFINTWRKDCFTSSMTQIVGAGLAALVFKLLNYGDLLTAAIASVAVIVAFLTYRQTINEINQAVGHVEAAEREKAETERERRREAEAHASQLADSLELQERANEALRKSRRDFKHAALHDSLTGLANRKHLGDMLRVLIDQYRDGPSKNFHVLFLDIQRFKNINDSLGHSIGDKVLIIAAKRFVRLVSPSDTVARLGGDEFAIILRDLSTVGKAQKVARRIAQSIAQPFSLSGNRISVGVKVGIAPCDAEYRTPEEILRDADIAMHFAKERNSGVAVFTKELRERFLERARLELDLRHAVERGELMMHYQPIVSLTDGRIVGFEALLRWNHHDDGLIPPSKFIPIAEESGLIQGMTVWILAETTRQLAEWRRISSAVDSLLVSVNISGKHLSTDDLIDDVELALENSRLPAGALKLEITESIAMENAEHTINVLNRLKKLGVQLSIDDFGTGYSSLSHLHRLPFDTLKIDRSFVSRVGENGENSEVLQTIISLAKNLKMRVIAEGIETESQLAVLRNLGCDFGQGYLLAKPQTAEKAEKLLYEMASFLPGHITEHYSAENTKEDREADAVLPVF